jgi:hypothetical protein
VNTYLAAEEVFASSCSLQLQSFMLVARTVFPWDIYFPAAHTAEMWHLKDQVSMTNKM